MKLGLSRLGGGAPLQEDAATELWGPCSQSGQQLTKLCQGESPEREEGISPEPRVMLCPGQRKILSTEHNLWKILRPESDFSTDLTLCDLSKIQALQVICANISHM